MRGPTARGYAASYLLAACAGGCFGPDAIIGLGQRIRHDDFDYSVTQVERTSDIGDRHTDGVFVIVTFRVENRAERVGHRWNNWIAYVLDDEGRVFENDQGAQRELLRTRPFIYAEEYVTPPGEADETSLVFELPASSGAAQLKVRGFLMMGDVFDGNRFRRTRVQLY